jgi:3-methyl-2-oxobutanoate hydroxymethyltransferase
MSATAPTSPSPRVTAPSLRAMKEAGRPIVMLTAYDYHAARLVDASGVDAVLVGDSLGMTVLGHSSTLPVTMDDMVRATAAVSRACSHVLVIADMPFMSYAADYAEGMRNAGRLIAEGGAHAVKVENASSATLELVAGLTDAGVPVMGHVGLTPQSVNTLGGYRTQGKDVSGATLAIADAIALEEAGAFAVVLECVPSELAERIGALLTIPTIGIGAGAGCDGQVQVFHDILGLGDFLPRHAKRYAELGAAITQAVAAYADDVRDGAFPGEGQSTHLAPEVLAELDAIIEGSDAAQVAPRELDTGLLP